MTNPKKIRITAYIDADVHEVLREAIFMTKSFKSDIINVAIEYYLIDHLFQDLWLSNKISTKQFDKIKIKLHFFD